MTTVIASSRTINTQFFKSNTAKMRLVLISLIFRVVGDFRCLKACNFNFVVSGLEKILTETENLSQGAEAQYSLSQSFVGSGDREVEFTGL